MSDREYAELLSALVDLRSATELGFERIDRRFQRVDSRIAALEGRIERLELRFDGLESRFDGLVRIERFESRFDGLESRPDSRFDTQGRQFEAVPASLGEVRVSLSHARLP